MQTIQNKILIVEDDKTLQSMYTKYLENRGYIVVSAYDGLEGLQKALQEHPDIILLDIRMPKMDGITMLTKFREDSWGKSVPVIILTNLDANDEILKGVVKGQPSYYLIKSNIKPESVVEYIEMVFENQKKEENQEF